MKIRQMYWTALKMSWRVWIVFQYVNLNYVPRQVTNNLFSMKPKQFYEEFCYSATRWLYIFEQVNVLLYFDKVLLYTED